MSTELQKAYQKEESPVIRFGGIMLDGKLVPSSEVNLVLKQFNRHGLVSGATGSGKTKSLQVLAEQLSLIGVPCVLMDMKGDLSGIAMPGNASSILKDRAKLLNIDLMMREFPVELLSLSQAIKGVPIRATVQDFGPLLFSRMLELNDTQSGVVTILFEFAKDKSWALVDLDDFKALLKFSQSDNGVSEIEKQYGRISGATVSTIMRKIIEIESQEGQFFFGEPAFEVQDLMQVNDKGMGVISILRLMDMQDKPFLFSTFMVKLLNDIYKQLPECGDLDKPKLVLFIDEAHLIFKNANKALLNLLDTIVKLIRSKGVGLIFCTQTPKDVPENILSQLGFKIQHSLRAFTANDRKAIELVAKNFPPSDFYQTDKLITALGIGEALLTAIDERGIPTPLVHCMIRPPESRMGILAQDEENTLLEHSSLSAKYQNRLEQESASEILKKDAELTNHTSEQEISPVKNKSDDETFINKISKNVLVRQITRDLFKKLTNFIIAMLKKKNI
jgi:hypothetical protein